MWRPGPAHRWHPTQGDGTTARGSFPTFGIQSHTDACTHVGAVVRWDRFSTIEKRRWGCAGCHAPSARVRESDDATARAVCRPSVSVHTDACTQSWRGRSMRQIFDHPETVMGLRRLARAVCEGVRARWRDGAGSLLTLGIRSLRCLHTHWRGRSMGGRRDGLLSIEKQWWDGARGSTKSARVSESDGATSQAVWLPLVSGCTDGCTHLSVGGWAPQIFRHRETVLGLCWWPRAVCESVGERDGATAQAVCGPWVFPVTPMRAHILARAVDVTDFATEKWCWDCAGGCAQSARVSESDCVTGQAVCRPSVSSHTDACSHLGGRWT